MKLDQVNLPHKQTLSFNLVSLMKELKSFLLLVSLTLVDLSKGNLATSKACPTHQLPLHKP